MWQTPAFKSFFFLFCTHVNSSLSELTVMANEHTTLIPKEPPPPYSYTCRNPTSSAFIAQRCPKPTFRQWLDSKILEHDSILRRILAAIMIATIISSAVMLFLWRLQQLEDNPEDGPPSKFPTHRPWSTYSTSWFVQTDTWLPTQSLYIFWTYHTPTSIWERLWIKL